MTKRVKCRCIHCKKMFVTSKNDKIFMKHFTGVICDKCEDELAKKIANELPEKIFNIFGIKSDPNDKNSLENIINELQ